MQTSTFKSYFNYYLSGEVPESKKDADYYKAQIDFSINSFAVEKLHIKQARNFYEGQRDKRDFAFLENEFGVTSPIDVKFNTGLIHPRLNVLLGIAVSEPVIATVGFNDQATSDLVSKEKRNRLVQEAMVKFLALNGPDEKAFNRMYRKYSKVWQSDYEKACHNALQYLLSDREQAFSDKYFRLCKDLLVTGEGYYRMWVPEVGADPEFEVINPINIFFNKNINQTFIKGCDRVVRREYMQKHEVLRKYGHLMEPGDIDTLFNSIIYYGPGNYINAGRNIEFQETSTMHQFESIGSFINHNIIEVFHVEWLDTEIVDEDTSVLQQVEKEVLGKKRSKNKRRKVNRYEGIRLGWNVYIGCGKSKHVVRDPQNPHKCYLTYNGLRLSDENGKPYSMVLKNKDLQDTYDLLHYFRDNKIALSGNKGTRVNFPGIPTWLDKTSELNRLIKWIQFRKQGMELYDQSQEGAQINQVLGDFDASMDFNGVAAINAVIKQIEEQASLRTGVTPSMLGFFEQRDAVGNVKVGITQSMMIVEPIFNRIRLLRKEIFSDWVQCAQIAWGNGKRGHVVLGNTSYTFDIKPEYFTHGSYNIHIMDGPEYAKQMAKLESLVAELIKAQLISPDVALKLTYPLSLTEALETVTLDLEEQASAMERLQQADQAIAERDKAIKDFQSQLQQLQAKAGELEEFKMNIEMQKLQETIRKNQEVESIEREKLRAKEELEKQRNDVEKIQAMITTSSKDDEVKNIR